MKKITWCMFLFFVLVGFSARADKWTELERDVLRCPRTDAHCVGLAVVDALRNNGGNPSELAGKIAYTCDWTGEMTIQVLLDGGKENSVKFDIRSASNCTVQAGKLMEVKTSLYTNKVTRVAICDWTGRLQQFIVYSDGRIEKGQPADYHQFNTCLVAADKLNDL